MDEPVCVPVFARIVLRKHALAVLDASVGYAAEGTPLRSLLPTHSGRWLSSRRYELTPGHYRRSRWFISMEFNSESLKKRVFQVIAEVVCLI